MMVVLIILGAAGCSPAGNSVDSPAIDFTLQSLDGDSVSLSDFRGRPVLLNFWATWCGYCREEMPYIQQIDDEWPDSELVVLLINVGERTSMVEDYMEAYDLSMTVLLDSRRTVSEKYDVIGLPTTYFIDKDGIIREKVPGAFRDKDTIEYYLDEIVP
jgi:thiol-disulfide isomerase/thioredoxin